MKNSHKNISVKEAVKTLSKKQIIALAAYALITVVLVSIPFPASDLYIRFYLDEIRDSKYDLYYSTDSADGFSPERLIRAETDYSDMHITFRLDSSLAGHITGLRLDFPSMDQVVCINNVTVSSAGIVKRQYDPCYFFLEDNLASSNDIDSITLVTSRDLAYVAAKPDDPYLILSSGLCRQITDCYSRFRLTRLLICLFPAACCLMVKLRIFKAS